MLLAKSHCVLACSSCVLACSSCVLACSSCVLACCSCVLVAAVSPFSTVNVAPHNSSYHLGDEATLSCTSLGGPNNTFLWVHNGSILTHGPRLTLTNITARDGGVYTCVAINNAGIGSDTTDVYVHPYIVLEPVSNIYTVNGSFVELECIVDGFPSPNVTWQTLGIDLLELAESNVSRIGRDLTEFDNLPLQFSPVNFGDEGYYRCVVNAQTPQGVALVTVTSQPTLITGECSVLHSKII